MKKKNILILGSILIILTIGYLLVSQFLLLRKEHSTFENYYAFRGCTKLLKRTSTYGVCQLSSGQTIKLVEFRGKWYLDGDLPQCIFGMCL